jgi:hypothetical protein
VKAFNGVNQRIFVVPNRNQNCVAIFQTFNEGQYTRLIQFGRLTDDGIKEYHPRFTTVTFNSREGEHLPAPNPKLVCFIYYDDTGDSTAGMLPWEPWMNTIRNVRVPDEEESGLILFDATHEGFSVTFEFDHRIRYLQFRSPAVDLGWRRWRRLTDIHIRPTSFDLSLVVASFFKDFHDNETMKLPHPGEATPQEMFQIIRFLNRLLIEGGNALVLKTLIERARTILQGRRLAGRLASNLGARYGKSQGWTEFQAAMDEVSRSSMMIDQDQSNQLNMRMKMRDTKRKFDEMREWSRDPDPKKPRPEYFRRLF